MIKAVLFDFGQTLVDSSEGFRLAEKNAQVKIFQNLGLDSWPEFLECYRGLRHAFHNSSNFSRKALWEVVYRHFGQKVNEDFLYKAESTYWETVKSLTKPFPETRAILAQLASEYRLGLITNTQGQQTPDQHRLSLFPGLERFFELIIVAGEEGIKPKPACEPFLTCLEKLEISPAEAIYVGDDWRNDIRGAEKVGIQPVWLQHHSVSRKWPLEETTVPVIISLEQLPEWLESNSKTQVE